MSIDLIELIDNIQNSNCKSELNFDHIWDHYYWWIVAIIGAAIILFFLILILASINGPNRGLRE